MLLLPVHRRHRHGLHPLLVLQTPQALHDVGRLRQIETGIQQMEVEHIPPLLHEHLHVADQDGVDVLGGKAQERPDVIQAREEVEGDVDSAGAGDARRFPHPLLPLRGVRDEVGDAGPAFEEIDLDVAQRELRAVGNLPDMDGKICCAK